MSSEGFACNLEEFKAQVAKFARRADSGKHSAEALSLGFRTIGLYYLNMTGSDADRLIAVGYLEFAARRKIERELLL